MRRTDLEAKLAALGWYSTGEDSGVNHVRWRHARRPGILIPVPKCDIVNDATAERLIARAGGRVQ